MKSDIEIARASSMKPIVEVASKIGIPEDSVLNYGKYKAKISLDFLNSLEQKPDGKLILVTAMTPTPAGEGKTTTTVGLGDALNAIGKKSHHLFKGAILRSMFWNERWSRRWWIFSSCSYGRY